MRFRSATINDLPKIVQLLVDDELGSTREQVSLPVLPSYEKAFTTISNDPGEEIILALKEKEIVGCLQLSIIPYLTYKGSRRAQIEGVRVSKDFRGQGIGKKLILHAIEKARSHGVIMVQLTSTSSRKDSIRFYEKLGFKATHVGMKLFL